MIAGIQSVGCSAISLTHNLFGSSRVKFLSTRSIVLAGQML